MLHRIPGAIRKIGTAARWNVGTSPFNVVQINSAGKLPAIDGSLLTGLASGTLTGVFSVNRNGVTQTGMSSQVFNKVQYTTKLVDANTWYDATTNFRYQPSQSGYYFIYHQISTPSNGETCEAAIYKTGTKVAQGSYIGSGMGAANMWSTVAALVFLNGSTDYVEGFAYLPLTVTTLLGDTFNSFLTGFKVA